MAETAVVDAVAETVEPEQVVADQDPDADIVEGADEIDDGIIRVGQAALLYFDWREQRAATRKKRGLDPEALTREARVAVARFVSHVTPQVPIADLTPHQMTAYQDLIGANTTQMLDRLMPVKDFLRFCWKERALTETNLGNNIRIRKPGGAKQASVAHEEGVRFEVTQAGLEKMRTDLEQLQEEMPRAIEAVAQAREDKDIRENAPLEAAREYQERLKSRIDELEYQIAHSHLSEGGASGRAHVGSTVKVALLGQEPERVEEYTLVGPTEVDPVARRISIESPMGRGLIDQSVGSQVEINAPRGVIRFRIVAVEG